MSISEPKKVDFIGIDKKSLKVILTISDDLEWIGEDKGHQLLLQEKINNYLAFIESGEIYDSYPNAKGHSIVIEVVGKFEISKEAFPFLEYLKQVIKGAGFEFKTKRFED